jgi:hypothetical protein
MTMTDLMEAGKLTGAAWLSRRWSVMSGPWRTVLGLVVMLAVINAVSVFGQLSAAHRDPHVDAVAVTSRKVVESDAKIATQEQSIADLDRTIAQIGIAIEEAAKRGRSVSAMNLERELHQRRDALVADRKNHQLALVGLKTSCGKVTGEQQKAAADIGILSSEQFCSN